MNQLEVGRKKQQIKRQYRYAFKQTTGVCLQNTTDYSPFGVTLDGRTIERGFYRRGFNGMEKDDEVKGEGNSYDFGARMYDSRLGRFIITDPYTSKIPNVSPFGYASNSPIQAIDYNGLYTIFVNGYTGNGAPPKKPYWQGAGRHKNRSKNEFIDAAHKHFGDGIGKYVDGSSWFGSDASSRQQDGREIGEELAIEIKKAIRNGEEIKNINLVTHSMGAAVGEGIIEVFMQDPVLSPLVKKGQVVHFSPADADGIVIPAGTEQLNRVQINYTGDKIITEWADMNVNDNDGGYFIPGIEKVGVVNADINVLHKGVSEKDKNDYDFHDDTKTYKEAWNAVKIVEKRSKNGEPVQILSKELLSE